MKILSILFTVIALVAAGVSGGVYFVTKGKLEEKQAELESTQETLATSQGELAKARSQILSTEQLLKNTRGELADAKKESFSLSRKLVALQTKSQSDSDTVSSLENQLAELKTDRVNLRAELLARKKSKPEDLVGASAEDVREFESEIADLEKKLELLEDQLSNAGSRTFQARSPAGGGATAPVEAPANLEGKIARVNSASGILVLARGSSDGIQPNGEYVLKKSGYLLARVKVKTLTPDHAVATIVPNIGIPNSLRSGDVVDITQ